MYGSTLWAMARNSASVRGSIPSGLLHRGLAAPSCLSRAVIPAAVKGRHMSSNTKYARLISEMPQLAKAQQEAEEELLALPGVVGIHAGLSRQFGEESDKPVVRVLLTDKPSVRQLPQKIGGYEVEATLGTVEDLVVNNPDNRSYEKLAGGILICRMLPDGSARTGGTLGVILNQLAVDGVSAPTPVMLTNYHVVESELLIVDTNPNVSQAAPASIGSRVVGEILAGTRQTSVGDAAILSLRDGVAYKFQEVEEIGALVPGTGYNGSQPPSLGMAVRKRGATTRLTKGAVVSTNLSIRLVPSDPSLGVFTNQLLVDPVDSDGVFCDSGDSGSIVVDGSGHLVGLLYRMFEDDVTGKKYGIASPIEPILRHFRLQVAAAQQSSCPAPEAHVAEPQQAPSRSRVRVG